MTLKQLQKRCRYCEKPFRGASFRKFCSQQCSWKYQRNKIKPIEPVEQKIITRRRVATAPCQRCGKLTIVAYAKTVGRVATACYSCVITANYIPKEGGGYTQRRKLSTPKTLRP